jgi:hypothetical protein
MRWRVCRILVIFVRQGPTGKLGGVQMKKWRVLGILAVGALITGAGVAAAGNFTSSAQSDFYASGEHQFYMWCPASGSHMATETGKNAEDAQLRLYETSKAAGHSACWPVWQGRARV